MNAHIVARGLVVVGTIVPMLAFGAVAKFRATFNPGGLRPGWWHLDSGGMLLLAVTGTVAGLYCARFVAHEPYKFRRGAVLWGACSLVAVSIPRFDGADIFMADLPLLAGGAVVALLGRRLARAA